MVKHISHLWDCTVATYNKENERALEYTSLCKECYEWHETEGLILYDEDQENEWIHGK